MKLRLIIETDEYAGLEDSDQFSSDVEFMGEAHLGPHVFRIWNHKQLGQESMEINGYEFGFGEDHMPTAQKENIIRTFLKLRPDIASHIKTHDINERLIDIGLILTSELTNQ